MNSIFVLKPILDLIYEDAKKDREEIEALKKRVKELEEELKSRVQLEAVLRTVSDTVPRVVPEAVPRVVPEAALRVVPEAMPRAVPEAPYGLETLEIDDSQYAAEASLPATSIPVSVKNEIVEEGDTKTIKMINNMTKKEYMKEYQKNYRKRQKESRENKEIVMNV